MFDCGSNSSEVKNLLGCRHPSPVSILEHSIFAESSNSSETGDSTSTEGMGSAALLIVGALHVNKFIRRT